MIEGLANLSNAAAEAAQSLREFREAFTRYTIANDKRPLEMRMRLVLVRMWKEQLRGLEQELLPKLAEYGEQGITEAFRPLTPSQASLLLQILNTNEREWAKSLAKIIADALKAGSRRTRETLDVELSFDLSTTEIEEYIRTHGAELVTRINSTTRDRIRTMLEEGIRNKETYRQIAKRIRDTFEGFGGRSPLRHIRDRAELVVVNEIGNAYSDAQLRTGDRIQARGIMLEKEWIDVGDDRVSEDCIANRNAGWIDHNATFPSGHSAPCAHPGCRCAMGMRRKPTPRP